MKDLDKIFFRLSWWQYLRWQDDATKATVLSLFFNHCSGIENFDVAKCTSLGTPSLAEQLVMPMIMQYEADKSAYIAKCETNSRNAKRNKDVQSDLPISQATANGSQATAHEHTLSQGEDVLSHPKGNEKKGKEKKDNELFVSAVDTADKKNIILATALNYLSKGIKNPYAKATAFYDLNDARDWQEVTSKGATYNHGKSTRTKVAYLTAASKQIEKGMSPIAGQIAAVVFRYAEIFEQNMLDNLTSVVNHGSYAEFVFTTKECKDTFASKITNMTNSTFADMKAAIAAINDQIKDITTSSIKN